MGDPGKGSILGPGFLYPPPPGWHELLTASWRLWLPPVRAALESPADGLITLYVTATEANLHLMTGSVASWVAMGGANGALAIRVVRESSLLATLNRLPYWAGKAVSLYLPVTAAALLPQLDRRLAEQGLDGPPVLRAKPYGGQSGALFVSGASTGIVAAAGDSRRGRLAALLDGGLPEGVN